MVSRGETRDRLEQERLFVWTVHLLVLFGLALAQPLYDLLARYPQFFVARHSGPVELVLLTLSVSVWLPLLFVLPDALLIRLCPRCLPWWRNLLLAGLLFFMASPVLKKLGTDSTAILLPAALLFGFGGTYAYRRFAFIRLFLSLLSPSILLFPAIFLFSAPISKLVLPHSNSAETTLGLSPPIKSDIPLVMVVFDEFPLDSLLDREGKIDPIRFPSFAALAANSYWFPEAQTISDSTMHAIPALLTGRYPTGTHLPIAADHSPTLFNLLGRSHRMKVIEPITQLCPGELCAPFYKPTVVDRLESLTSDLLIIYCHLVLPQQWTSKLPDIRQNWGNFAYRGFQLIKRFKRSSRDAVGTFDLFLASLKKENGPTLYFLHTPLPHFPWTYLPSGKLHSSKGAPMRLLSGKRWIDDESAVERALQLHLLQVGFVDRLLGRLVKRLKEEDLYDRSVVTIVADHGISFVPGLDKRALRPINYRQILSVPLLIKLPGQERGQRIEGRAETIDLVPTIADILKLQIPWPVDGSSLLSKSPPPPQKRRVFTGGREFSYWKDPAENLSATVLCRDGMALPINSESVTARLDFAQKIGPEVRFIGWAADERNPQAADRVLLFVDGKLVSDQPTGVPRPDVARFYSDQRFGPSGFDFTLALSELEEGSSVRAFALLGDQVSEARYPPDYAWSTSSANLQRVAFDSSAVAFCAEAAHGSSPFLIEEPGLTAQLMRRREEAGRIIGMAATADPDGFLREGRFRELIGVEVKNLKRAPASGIQVRIDQEAEFEDVNPEESFVPAFLTGKVSGRGSSKRLNLAVAVNGIIRAVNPTTQIEDKPTAFFSIVPEESFRAGSNSVELFVVREAEEGYLLEKTL